jgi:hypothetical protein
MNRPDRLSQSLRELADSSPQPGLSAALGESLKYEFRQYHRRRRRLRRAVVLAGIIVLLAGLAPFAPRWHRYAAPGAAAIAQGADRLVQQSAGAPARTAAQAPGAAQPGGEDANGEFMALPSYDPAVPVDSVRVVRLRIPGRDLNLVGIPVRQDAAEKEFLADVLVAQDGTPYALRLVNQ